jgi:beta-glucosidase
MRQTSTMIKSSLSLLLLIFGISINAQKSIDQKATELISRMTLEEKAGQLVQYSGFECHRTTELQLQESTGRDKTGKSGIYAKRNGCRRNQSFPKIGSGIQTQNPNDIRAGCDSRIPNNLSH